MIDWLGIHLMTRHTSSHNEDIFMLFIWIQGMSLRTHLLGLRTILLR